MIDTPAFGGIGRQPDRLLGLVDHPEADDWGTQQRAGRPRDLAQDGLQVQRGGDQLCQVVERPGPLDPRLEALGEAGVLHGDGRELDQLGDQQRGFGVGLAAVVRDHRPEAGDAVVAASDRRRPGGPAGERRRPDEVARVWRRL